MKSKKQKTLSIYFCPRCKSKDVGYTFKLRNLFGVIPTMICKKCNFKNTTFPQLEITEKKLKELEKKMQKQNKKKTTKPKTKNKLLCPECWSDNVVPAGRWKGDSTMLCKNCNYRGSPFLQVEDKPKRKKK